MALNEYGLFKLNDEKKTDFSQPVRIKSEEEIYHKLDLHFIPPEHREDLGEFEYYQVNEQMDLVDASDIKGVIHMHSIWSDGSNTLSDMAEESMDIGYDDMGNGNDSSTAACTGDVAITELH